MSTSIAAVILAGCLFCSFGNSKALAADWKDCIMEWQDIEAGTQDMSQQLITRVMFNEDAQVMRFEHIEIEARLQDSTTRFLDDETRIRLSLWEEHGSYRMTYVWHDMKQGLVIARDGGETFVPNIIYLANFFGGTLDC